MISDEQQRAQRKKLDTDDLLFEARRRAALTDYGDESFLTPLRKLMDSSAREVSFHEKGIQDLREATIRELVNRLRMEEDIKRHPEILNEDVSDPIILLGLPRCGTTRTHRSIGADPNLLKTFMWQVINPARFPDAVAGEPDPRIAAAAGKDLLLEDNPAIRAAHVFGAQEVTSDLYLLGLTFNSEFINQGRMYSPSFVEWIRSRSYPSDVDNYRYVRKITQYLQWQQGGRRGRRWLMKNEGAVGELDAICEVYPKATLVHLHRDPRICIASTISLSKNVALLRLADLEVKAHARYHLDRTKLVLDRYLGSRKRLGLGDKIFDVAYKDVCAKPIQIAEEIYRRANLSMTEEGRSAMLKWEAENVQGKHGEHRYSLEEYGLDEKVIETSFPDYIAKFAKYI